MISAPNAFFKTCKIHQIIVHEKKMETQTRIMCTSCLVAWSMIEPSNLSPIFGENLSGIAGL